MTAYWFVNTHGDPLGAVQHIIQKVWETAPLDGVLASLDGNEEILPRPQWLEEQDRVGEINPFRPLMTMNAARLVPDLVKEHPGQHFGAILRPCEFRALVEMVKHDGFDLDNVLTISVDCLSTVPVEEYRWRASRKSHPGGMTEEALHFARQGGIAAYRFRAACQVCVAREAHGADLNLHVLGLPVRQQILIQGGEHSPLDLAELADGPADPAVVQQHQHLLAQLHERHQHTLDRLRRTLADHLPPNVEAVIAMIEGCGGCQQCFNVCPICSVDRPRQSSDGHFLRDDFIRWLVSCAGCGMCEQSCPNHLPLNTIFGEIRRQLTDELGYLAGQSLDDPLPVL